jgi:tetratricopeptide (TPR) repeat protein
VNQASAKLQVVVAQAGAFNFAVLFDNPWPASVVASFLGGPIRPGDPTYRAASPITYVTPDDPPVLLIHGDDDQVVPFTQSEFMLAALEEHGIEARLIRIPGGGHGANDVPEMVRWLNRNLLSDVRAEALESLLEAYSYLSEGGRLARAGDISDALQAYQNARERDVRLTIPALSWNLLCWRGSLWGHAAEVMEACEHAVALAPDNGDIRDSRGLARALTGDHAGAIDDFEVYVARTRSDRGRAQRLDWIAALQSGENPFTAEVLGALIEQ